MKASHRGRKTIVLVGLCLLVVVYISLLNSQPTLTGSLKDDGIISVLLGLYICTHPAANWLDVVLFGRFNPQQRSSTWAGGLWWGLNLLTLLAGWAVIYVGMQHFMTK